MKRARRPGATARARRLRGEPTTAERAAWRVLRRMRDEGVRVRRQQPLGPYTVDFVVLNRKLVIELDGPVHALFGSNDDARDEWLRAEGYRVLRLSNETALDPDRLVTAVRAALASTLTLRRKPASPSPRGGGG